MTRFNAKFDVSTFRFHAVFQVQQNHNTGMLTFALSSGFGSENHGFAFGEGVGDATRNGASPSGA